MGKILIIQGAGFSKNRIEKIQTGYVPIPVTIKKYGWNAPTVVARNDRAIVACTDDTDTVYKFVISGVTYSPIPTIQGKTTLTISVASGYLCSCQIYPGQASGESPIADYSWAQTISEDISAYTGVLLISIKKSSGGAFTDEDNPGFTLSYV